MASWAEDQERGQRFDELLREEPGFMPDPKPARRVKADMEGWERMQALMGRACQVCGGKAQSAHHIVPRSQGGDDVLENLAPVCGHGTRGCHGDVEARLPGARTRLRLHMTDEQLEYVRTKKGDAWIDRHYPQSEATKGTGSSDA